MKPRCSNQRNHALTITEILVVIRVMFVLAVLLLPYIASHKRPLRIECLNNLQEIGLSFRGWAVDHGGV